MTKQAVAYDIDKFLVLNGIPRGPKSKVYIVDTVNGSDNNPGTSIKSPLASLEAAYALTVADQHDVVIMLAGDTGNALAAAITWSKDHTHLIGWSGNLPGMGQRVRVTGSTSTDLSVLVTFSGNGCIVRNVQFFNGGDADADAGAVIVSGSRNEFTNCFFAGMGHATPAARAGSYSLSVTGSENYFDKCTIGLDTIVRAAANSELLLSGVRNEFHDCKFISDSVTSGKFLVAVDNSGGDLRYNYFSGECMFYNYSENWATGIANAFDMPAAGSTHYVILGPQCFLVGVGLGWADTVTHVYGAGAAPNAGFGVSLNPTT